MINPTALISNKAKPVLPSLHHVGYSDVNAFREVFKKFTTMSPVDYRNKYAR